MSRLQLLLCEAERDPAMDPYILVIILTLSGGDQHVTEKGYESRAACIALAHRIRKESGPRVHAYCKKPLLYDSPRRRRNRG